MREMLLQQVMRLDQCREQQFAVLGGQTFDPQSFNSGPLLGDEVFDLFNVRQRQVYVGLKLLQV